MKKNMYYNKRVPSLRDEKIVGLLNFYIAIYLFEIGGFMLILFLNHNNSHTNGMGSYVEKQMAKNNLHTEGVASYVEKQMAKNNLHTEGVGSYVENKCQKTFSILTGWGG